MQRSTDRILTTHAGSLPRPDDMLPALRAKLISQPVDQVAFDARVRRAVADIVREQVEHGLDVVNDGEAGKPSFMTYLDERISGFEQRQVQGALPASHAYLAGSREFLAFPEFYMADVDAPVSGSGVTLQESFCAGPIRYTGQAAVARDIANLQAALAATPAVEGFLPAVSPNQIAYRRPNEHYRNDEEYEVAIADALHEEYRAIVDAGLLVQIDDPQLLTQWTRHPELSLADYRRWAEAHIAILNHALRGLPRERVRFHTCFSIGFGPRVHELELRHVVDLLLTIEAGAYSFEAGNARHEHEWRVWEGVQVPEDVVLIPGVITQAAVTVEHPELVADRVERFARIVGRERVIAGADCGFASTARAPDMHASIVWAKLDALVAGARLASERLWGRG
jgi:5-methyltetrahydropteroyltriglutamate--homocysteine methyltransferase